jgi:hypothetical protein
MRNRDHRGRFRGNKKQQKEETSTQKAIETETGTLAEETIEQNIEPRNTTTNKFKFLVIQTWLTQLIQKKCKLFSGTLTL